MRKMRKLRSSKMNNNRIKRMRRKNVRAGENKNEK